jgi:Family of unknown function (DUF5719)
MGITSGRCSRFLALVIATAIAATFCTAWLSTSANCKERTDAQVDNSTWYLPEGSTAWGFATQISIENPNSHSVEADMVFMRGNGSVIQRRVYLYPLSQTTIDPSEILGEADFSTRVVSVDGSPIAVDRSMIWQGLDSTGLGDLHTSIGVTSPATDWYLPEGSSKWGFECWLLIQNPNPFEVDAYVTYMIEGGAPVVKIKRITPNSRATYNMADDVGPVDASIRVSCAHPVVPERSMYRNSRREGHDSVGTTVASNDFYLAEGTTAWGFTTYVLVQNPGSQSTEVSVTFMTPEGPVGYPKFTMPPTSRRTIRVNDYLPGKDLSVRVHGSQPIIAERAMYWGADTIMGEVCHDSIGMDSMHSVFFLPEGDTTDISEPDAPGWFETWTCVQNPNPVPVTIRIDYLGQYDDPDYTFQTTMAPNSRQTFNMAEYVSSSRASIRVTSLTTGRKVMAERAMYLTVLGYRICGSESIGGYDD